MRRKLNQLFRRGFTLLGGGMLLTLPGGCEPITAQTLSEFSIDFALSALAAWLL